MVQIILNTSLTTIEEKKRNVLVCYLMFSTESSLELGIQCWYFYGKDWIDTIHYQNLSFNAKFQ